jgi:hypothetical protein
MKEYEEIIKEMPNKSLLFEHARVIAEYNQNPTDLEKLVLEKQMGVIMPEILSRMDYATQCLISFGKYIAGYLPGYPGWTNLDQQVYEETL